MDSSLQQPDHWRLAHPGVLLRGSIPGAGAAPSDSCLFLDAQTAAGRLISCLVIPRRRLQQKRDAKAQPIRKQAARDNASGLGNTRTSPGAGWLGPGKPFSWAWERSPVTIELHSRRSRSPKISHPGLALVIIKFSHVRVIALRQLTS